MTGTGDPAKAPPHYRHHADDPIAITHSSGTTRMPAAVRALAREPVRRDTRAPAAAARGRTAPTAISQRSAGRARRRDHHAQPGAVQPLRAAVPVHPGRPVRAQRRGGARRDRAVAADRRVRLRRHLGRAGPLRPVRARPGLGVATGSTPATARTSRTSAGWSRSAPTTESPATASATCPARCSSTASAPPRWATPRSTSPTPRTPSATAAASASRTPSPRSRCSIGDRGARCRSARSATSG